MKKLNLTIEGYKCFVNQVFEIPNLMVLTGANAAGKSSVIQSLLFMRRSVELGGLTGNVVIDLHDTKYAFDYGSSDDIINSEMDFVRWNLEDMSIGFAALDFSSSVIPMQCDLGNYGLNFVMSDFAYLNAERMGPRSEVEKYRISDFDCGCHGERTASVINQYYLSPVNKKRFFNSQKNGTFQIQLDDWINYIFPGVVVRSVPVGSSSYKVVVRNNLSHGHDVVATNVGFGISYALPIVVEALLIGENGWLIVENPEAHLHAKAQSNMGYFLGVIASSGVRVVVETHSEHVVNGIRRAVAGDIPLQSDDVAIYFMDKNQDNLVINNKILIEEDGNLSDSPVDFFDQVRQDLFEIIRGKMA